MPISKHTRKGNVRRHTKHSCVKTGNVRHPQKSVTRK